MLAIPGILKMLMLVFKSPLLVIGARVSFFIGILIMIFFIGLLSIEFYQDHELDLYYESRKNIKLSIGNGMYECQCCGNKTVKAGDKSCGVCGMRFKETG